MLGCQTFNLLIILTKVDSFCGSCHDVVFCRRTSLVYSNQRNSTSRSPAAETNHFIHSNVQTSQPASALHGRNLGLASEGPALTTCQFSNQQLPISLLGYFDGDFIDTPARHQTKSSAQVLKVWRLQVKEAEAFHLIGSSQ